MSPKRPDIIDAQFEVITPPRDEPMEYSQHYAKADRSIGRFQRRMAFANFMGLLGGTVWMVGGITVSILIGRWIYTTLGHWWGYLPN